MQEQHIPPKNPDEINEEVARIMGGNAAARQMMGQINSAYQQGMPDHVDPTHRAIEPPTVAELVDELDKTTGNPDSRPDDESDVLWKELDSLEK